MKLDLQRVTMAEAMGYAWWRFVDKWQNIHLIFTDSSALIKTCKMTMQGKKIARPKRVEWQACLLSDTDFGNNLSSMYTLIEFMRGREFHCHLANNLNGWECQFTHQTESDARVAAHSLPQCVLECALRALKLWKNETHR